MRCIMDNMKRLNTAVFYQVFGIGFQKIKNRNVARQPVVIKYFLFQLLKRTLSRCFFNLILIWKQTLSFIQPRHEDVMATLQPIWCEAERPLLARIISLSKAYSTMGVTLESHLVFSFNRRF